MRHPFPATPGMTKGACQLLALRLRGGGVRLWRAPAAQVHHAMPHGHAWLAMRLRRGADARAIAPTLAAAYLPGLGAVAARLPSRLLALRQGVALLRMALTVATCAGQLVAAKALPDV